MNASAQMTGGSFLIHTDKDQNIFTPEDFSEEQQMMASAAMEFLEKEVLSRLHEIDERKDDIMPRLMEMTGELGLLGAAFPEKYGGLGEDFTTATLINECLGGGHSYAVAIAAHNGIGSLPILYFGTEEQKQKYIPKLASAEYKGAYALTEPNAGSDALSGKTAAVLSADGKHYILNGQKCWITNGGFADVYTVFAKVDGKEFTAFIVEKGTKGFSLGEEEHKMGIKGSSTCMLFFQDCEVPVENVLGEIGKGHVIAFNILNIGRLKLCAAALGAAKQAAKTSVIYAKTREQFKQPIANFGAIQHKVAQMAIDIFASETTLYRTSKWIDEKEEQLAAAGTNESETLLGAAEEFAIECAMLKVIGSECLDYVVDEGVQIHGGNGFSDEYNISRGYRDSRINRIFEGTNEINRLLILDMFIKRAMKGRIDLLGPASALQKELTSIPSFEKPEGPFGEAWQAVENFKKATLLCAGAAVQKLMMQLEHEQEILMNLSDMAMDAFVAESMLLRLQKMQATGHAKTSVVQDMVFTFLSDASDRIHHNGKDAINAFAEGDEQKMLLLGLKRYTKFGSVNVKQARRNIAEAMFTSSKYFL